MWTQLLQLLLDAASAAVLCELWTIFFVLVGLASWGVLRAFGRGPNLRGLAVVLVPALAVVDRINSYFVRIFVPLLLFFLFYGVPKDLDQRLARGTPDSLIISILFALMVVGVAFAVVPHAIGLSLHETSRRVLRPQNRMLAAMLCLMVIMIGSSAIYFPGVFESQIAIGGAVFGCFFGRTMIAAIAGANRIRTPMAIAETEETSGGSCLFLHVSDVHATVPTDSIPVGGGKAGNNELARIADEITAGKRALRYLLITGDLVDRGRDEEWQAILPVLRRVRDAGTAVLLSPGNHDLVPSYDVLQAILMTMGPNFLRPIVDGARLLKYLQVAGELEPRLLSCSDNRIQEMVAHELRRPASLLSIWNHAHDHAALALGQKMHKRSKSTLRTLRSRDPATATEIAREFGARAAAVFPEIGQSEWERTLFEMTPDEAEVVLRAVWTERWTEDFPLRLPIMEDNIEFLITNSTAKEPRLAGSARGQMGAKQLERLAGRLSKTNAKTIVVLHHHAPFRFPVEVGEPILQRWAMLAHDPTESITLARLLRDKAATTGKQVFLLSGHIHLRSRCGRLADERASTETSTPVRVFESGALGEEGASMLPSGWLTALGRIEPRMVPRS
jgi:Calcineurin-like phosphoesterase